LILATPAPSRANASVDHLTRNGFRSRLAAGGFNAWKASGGATAPKAAMSTASAAGRLRQAHAALESYRPQLDVRRSQLARRAMLLPTESQRALLFPTESQ
jgi:hypothetical protein